MKVATWNVNGIRARSSQVMSWIDREEPDVICLQETKASLEQVPEPLINVAGYRAKWHGHKGYSGVALLLHERTFDDVEFSVPAFDVETRIVMATTGEVVFASVYIPNGGKDYGAKIAFLTALGAWAGELHAAGKRLVLCGDFNVARTDRDVHPMERKPIIGQSHEERDLIDAVFAHELVDVGRFVDPDNDRLFTWWAPWRNCRERNIGWRLDYIAANAGLVDTTTTCRVYREVGTSDHGPVIARLRDSPMT
jgi:exodeoxyribonuclease-3